MYRLFYVSHVFSPDVAGPSMLALPDTRLCQNYEPPCLGLIPNLIFARPRNAVVGW
jgi:hypothetical protein